jgi:hypothetical protein
MVSRHMMKLLHLNRKEEKMIDELENTMQEKDNAVSILQSISPSHRPSKTV